VKTHAYAYARGLWHLWPQRWRERLMKTRIIGAVVDRTGDALVKISTHDSVYGERYYQMIDACARTVSGLLAKLIVTQWPVRQAVDVGCGTGAVLGALREQGLQVRGLEYSSAAIKVCQSRGLPVTRFDLESDTVAERDRADVVISTEVAEHLPAVLADRYVATLCALSDRVVFTAATPGQGGLDHVNEQPHEYWIAKFTQRGYQFHRERSLQWRAQLAAGGAEACYAGNLMIFEKKAA